MHWTELAVTGEKIQGAVRGVVPHLARLCCANPVTREKQEVKATTVLTEIGGV
jgi:hypothetical protein